MKYKKQGRYVGNYIFMHETEKLLFMCVCVSQNYISKYIFVVKVVGGRMLFGTHFAQK